MVNSSKFSYYFLCCLLAILGVSCVDRTFETEEALWSYLKDEDNGYLQTKAVNGVVYSLLYKPTDLIVSQGLRGQRDEQQIDSLRSHYKNYIYFTLSMSRNNQELLNGVVGDRNRFGAMVSDLAFGMSEKVHLFTEKRDTISMLDYVYPRMYGMSRNTSMLLVYPREEIEKAEEINLVIEDLGFGTGEVTLSQEVKLMTEQPNLKL